MSTTHVKWKLVSFHTVICHENSKVKCLCWFDMCNLMRVGFMRIISTKSSSDRMLLTYGSFCYNSVCEKKGGHFSIIFKRYNAILRYIYKLKETNAEDGGYNQQCRRKQELWSLQQKAVINVYLLYLLPYICVHSRSKFACSPLDKFFIPR